MSPASLYLDLLKRALLNDIGLENEVRIAYLLDCSARSQDPDPLLLHAIRDGWAEAFERLRADRLAGRLGPDGLPGYGHTMIGRTRLDHLESCLDTVLAEGVEGDLLEAGIWRGGVGIFMRGYLAARNVTDRAVWLADSFAGLPGDGASHGVDPALAEHLKISSAWVRGAFERFNLWDDRVHLVEGWFADTLPALPVERLAVLRLDGDLFDSTMDALSALYPRLAPGAFVIIDDYHAVDACRIAVDLFRARRTITAPLEQIDWSAVFWRVPRP